MHEFLKFILGMNFYMFRTIPLSIVSSFSLYTRQWYMNSVLSWSCSQAVSKPVWHIPLLCVQWRTPDDGQRNCPKHVEFYSKNKFEKLVHLVGFIVRIYHDARSHERQNLVGSFRLADNAVSRGLIQRNRRADDMVSVGDVVSLCPFA
jgi:hypothetical protein